MDIAADPAFTSTFLTTMRGILQEERGEDAVDIALEAMIDSVFEDSLEFYATVMALEVALDIHLDLGKLENIGQATLEDLLATNKG
jgi:acyl carrier protein